MPPGALCVRINEDHLVHNWRLLFCLDLCDKQDVSGYPTIKYYKYGAFLVEYDGNPIEEDFIAFMTSPPQPLPPDQPGSDAEDPRDEL